MINCDVCGTLNFKENNYCTHCGNKLIFEHICPVCGESNSDLATHCIKCKNQLNPVAIDDFDILFNDFNQNLLENAEISNEEYNELLSNIFIKVDYSDISGKTAKDKILNIASIFTDCQPKSRGFERGFIFPGNGIYYEERLHDSVQIATVIHELAHYLLFHIIETLLCDILKVRSSSTIQSFVWFVITMPEFKIMSEFCAHTVEGRFIPYGYQNYGSFNLLVENSGYDEETLNSLIVLGNSFANEIIVYLEKYIDDDLRNDIKLQYMKDQTPLTEESIFLETDECYDLYFKNKFFISLLCDVLNGEKLNMETRKELEKIKEGIELS